MGDSYTAGLRDGGLRRESQEFSFPNLLARQLPGEGANFSQPLLAAGRGTDDLELVSLEADGTVAYSTEENLWVATIDWNAIRHTQPVGQLQHN